MLRLKKTVSHVSWNVGRSCLRILLSVLVISAAIFVFSCSGGGSSDQLTPTTLVGTMTAGDSAGTITLSFLSSAGKAAAGGLQTVSGTFNFLDAAGNPITITLSGTYNDGTGDVQVTGEGDFTAVGAVVDIKRYTIQASGTYLSGVFSGTVSFTEKATSTLTVSGSIAARPSATQTPPAPTTYKMTSGSWKASAILNGDGTFQWTAENSASSAKQFVYGTYVDEAGSKVCTPVSGRILDDAGAIDPVDLPQYRGVLNAAGTTFRIYEDPARTTLYMTYTTLKMLEVFHIYAGTFKASDDSYSGTQQMKLYTDNKAECSWSATTGSVSVGPGSGTYTLGANLNATFNGLGNFGGSLESYTCTVTGSVASGGTYSLVAGATMTGTWAITKVLY